MKTSKPALLDVNVLIALIDPAHEFHESAHAWFRTNNQRGWATCPITENGCLRILSKPGYPSPGVTLTDVRDILSEFLQTAGHLFWHDSISMLGTHGFDLTGAGPKNVTDIYLLGLAHANGGRLVSFDQGIRWEAVAGCTPGDLELLPDKL